ncbi:hypothetical protein [Micromonospora kangleipakensis]|uniref:hypothetical protein n=1 Tax=Micromonospora kangleipakensis TaxID=1077942 RepID=UPI001A91985A|nr:hypothetical protein [Micromonospora kangleipakensis]
MRGALDVLAVKLDGKPAAATTMRRKRSVFYNALQYAVELEELEFNPIDKLRVRSQRKKVAEVIDRRVVVNQRQALELLIALTYVGQRGKAKRGERLVAFFACLYFATLRPGEGLGLREQDCDLPETGWGRLTLAKSRPQAGKRWTDSGQSPRRSRAEAPGRRRAARRADPARAREDPAGTHQAIRCRQGRPPVPQRAGQHRSRPDILPRLGTGAPSGADAASG